MDVAVVNNSTKIIKSNIWSVLETNRILCVLLSLWIRFESKQTAKEWCTHGFFVPNRIRVQKLVKECVSVVWDAKISELKYELLQHQVYWPDLVASDFWLFSPLKTFVCGKQFSSNEEVIHVVKEYFVDLLENSYRDGIYKLEDRRNKCIKVERIFSLLHFV